MQTPNLDLPYLAAAQAQKHVTHNDALALLDALVQLTITSSVAAAPGAPAEGDRHVLTAATPFGPAGTIIARIDGAWRAFAPQIGWCGWFADVAAYRVWTGSDWQSLAGDGVSMPRLGINTTADLTNRLSVRTQAALLTADSGANGSMRLVCNKDATADTASITFQTAYSGRAEIGLAGNDALSFKTSADGSAWSTSLTAAPNQLTLYGGGSAGLVVGTGGVVMASLGDATAVAVSGPATPNLQANGTGAAPGFVTSRFAAGATAPGGIVMAKSRGATIGSHSAVAAQDTLGGLHFEGSDGTAFSRAASIAAAAEGTIAAGQVPGRLVLSVAASNGAMTERVRLNSSGNLGLGTTSPNARLTVAGAVTPSVDNSYALGSASYRWSQVFAANGVIQTSDARLKRDIRDCGLGLDFIRALRPAMYRWAEKGNRIDEITLPPPVTPGEAVPPAEIVEKLTPLPGVRSHCGFMAQEVKAALDKAGVDCGLWILDDPKDAESRQSLRYDELIAPIVKAIQELAARVDAIAPAAAR